MRKYVVLVLFTIACSSCRPVIKLIYGLKQPEYETPASLEEYSTSLNMPAAMHGRVSVNQWLENDLLNVPDVFVFSHDGNFIPYKDTLKPNCNGPAEVFLSELRREKKYYYSNELSMEQFLSKLDGITPDSIKERNADFYIFMTWAKWNGKKLYREKNSEWLRSLQENKHIKYNLILVNQDLQERWSAGDKKKLDEAYAY